MDISHIWQTPFSNKCCPPIVAGHRSLAELCTIWEVLFCAVGPSSPETESMRSLTLKPDPLSTRSKSTEIGSTMTGRVVLVQRQGMLIVCSKRKWLVFPGRSRRREDKFKHSLSQAGPVGYPPFSFFVNRCSRAHYTPHNNYRRTSSIINRIIWRRWQILFASAVSICHELWHQWKQIVYFCSVSALVSLLRYAGHNTKNPTMLLRTAKCFLVKDFSKFRESDFWIQNSISWTFLHKKYNLAPG